MAEEEHPREVDLIVASPHASRPLTTSQLLLAARMLTGSSPESTAARGPISGVLSQRLTKARAEFGELIFPMGYETLSTEQLQSATGYAALKILEAVDAALLVDAANQGAGAALLGARDYQVLQTTANLVFHWALNPILNRLSKHWKGSLPKPGVDGGPDVREAATLLRRLHTLLHQEYKRTAVSGILAGDYPIETLRGLLMLGWLPPGVCSESGLLRAGAMKLLGSVPLDTGIQHLGSALSRALPPHARTAATYLLSRRLMHPQGISALFYSTFDEDIGGDTMQRFDAVSQLLSLPPKGINNEEYLRAVIPRLVHILQEDKSPVTHHRAAAYCMAHMLDSAVSQASPNIIFPIFHRTFTFGNRSHSESSLSPLASVTTLSRLLTASPPTSGVPFVLQFVSPILAPLYSLVAYLDRTPTAEPSVRASARSLFDAWAKLVPAEEGVLLLWSVVDGGGGDWELVDDGECGLALSLVQRSQTTHMLLSELNCLIDGDLNSNPLNLRPDPTHFTELLYKVGRKELSSLFFVHLLDAYKEYSVQSTEEQDPTRALLLLQLLHHMQSRADSSAFLSSPERILPFIDYALQGRPPENGRNSALIGEDPVRTLRIVRDEDGVHEEDEDAHGDMMRTAVNLLLSLFEANPQFKPSPATTPIARISTRLGELTVHNSLALRQAAREARLVLTVRQAEVEGSTAANSIQVTGDDIAELARQRTRETYQEALHLLQDPLLPVRAHGLSLLRHLIARQSAAAEAENILDPALVPAILEIFLQSAQEEDSYIFLNAVQGLGLMAENSKSGRDVFLGLLRSYTGNRDNTGDLNRTELNLRLRIGEAISEVLRRTGPSLGSYADNILPSLLLVVRSHHLPTTLRMSAISLLSRCIDAAPVATSAYSHEIGEAMLDLLQLETVASIEKKKDELTATAHDCHHSQGAASSYVASKRIVQTGDIVMDADPLRKDAKLSPLRRSAIHLLTVLVKVLLDQVYESGVSGVHGDSFSAQRGLTTLRYIATTDADNTVRVLAAEGVDLLAQLRRAMLRVE